jgi:hypothetical protein
MTAPNVPPDGDASGAPPATAGDAEVDVLQSKLATRQRRARRVLLLRRVVAAVLVAIAAFGATASVIGVWGARTTLNTDRWVSTVGPLPSDPKVADAVSTYVTNELVTVLDVETRVADALPPRAAFLAAPVTTNVRSYIKKTVDSELQTPRFRTLWENLNRTAHQRIVAILEGNTPNATVTGEKVTLNLLPVINNVVSELEQRVPTLFGKTVNLPPITSGQVPPDVQSRVESALGVQLPANFSQITIYDGKELTALQDATQQFKRYVVLLVVGTLLCLALALWISPARRRTVLQLGVWLSVWVVAVTAIIRAVRDQILDGVPAGTYRDGAAAATQTVFRTLRDRGTQLIWLGIAIAAIAYLVGPGRFPMWVRGQAMRLARTVGQAARQLTSDEGAAWLRAHLDPLRIGGVIVAAVLALLLSSWTALVILLVVLAAYEVAVTLLAHPERRVDEAAGPPSGEVPAMRETTESEVADPVSQGSAPGGR